MGADRRRALYDDLAVFAVAGAVRLLYGLSISEGALFDHPQVDARLFWEEGVRLAAGGGADPVYFKPPLLGWFLSVLAGPFHAGPGGARFALLLLSALAAPTASRLARPLLGGRGAVLAGLFAALYAPAIFYGAELLPGTLALLLNGGALLLLGSAGDRRRPALHGAAGVLIGLSALARPTVLLFLPAALLLHRDRRKAMAALAAGAAVALAPALLHNARGGDFVPVSSNGGINFYLGNHEGADGRSAAAPELPSEPEEAKRVARAIAEREEGRALRPSEVSSFWYRRSLSWMASDPGGAARLLARKLYFTLNDRDLSDNIEMKAVVETSLPLRWAPFSFGILFALALPGLGILRKSRRGRELLLYALALIIPSVLFFAVGRFRLPLLPFLAVAASAGLLRIVDALRTDRRGALAPAGIALLALLFTRSALFGVDEDRTWHYHYLVGDALFRRGDAAGGLAAFEEAYRRNEDVPLTRNALGFLYAETGRNLDEAEALVRGALPLDPARRRFYLDSLGWVLHRQGRPEEAAAALEEAIPLFTPEEGASKGEALGHLAAVRDAQGRGAEADSLRREAARAGALFR